MTVDHTGVMRATRALLAAIGENPDREGLVDTPRRVADFWQQFMDYDPGNCDTTFEAVTVDQMVVVSGMRVWSLCEHHLLPFWCTVAIGYIADGRVLGLSKFARVAHAAAHGLQVQERLVADIAARIQALTGTEHVAVVATGEHLCMTMRGIQTPHRMTSSLMYGAFRDKPEARAEFMALHQSNAT